MWSRHGSPFKPIRHEDWSADGSRGVPVPYGRRPQFAPTAPIGTAWNSGFICGIRSVVGPLGHYSYAVMNLVQSAAHFIGSWRGSSEANASGAPVSQEVFKQWAARQFWGPTIQQWPYFKRLGGWTGLTKWANDMQFGVGVLRWRHQGWVALEAGVNGATIVTRPVLAPVNASVTVNLYTTDAKSTTSRCAQVHLEQLPGPNPIPGFSGQDAAQVCSDSIAARLTWGRIDENSGSDRGNVLGSSVLPAAATTSNGVVFRFVLQPHMQLFGLTLHSSTRAMKNDDVNTPCTPLGNLTGQSNSE